MSPLKMTAWEATFVGDLSWPSQQGHSLESVAQRVRYSRGKVRRERIFIIQRSIR